MAHVKIGPEFFAKAKNDYRNWRWALVREFAQNGLDCGSKEITFDVAKDVDGNTRVVFTNDGEPMTEDVLVNKLLSLGSSGKGFAGTVGGFGKAKEILYFAHLAYKVETGPLTVVGTGAEYELTRDAGEFPGTRSTVTIPGDEVEALAEAVRAFAAYAQHPAKLRLRVGGVETTLELKLHKGAPRREFAWGTVYTNQYANNLMIVRIGGVPMFRTWADVDRTVIVELKGTSADVLTANRDYLKGEHAESINRFLAELAVDKKSALKPKGESRRRYPGARYVHAKPRPATERKAPVTTGAPAVAAKTISVITFGDKGGAAPTANTLVVPTANPALVLDPARPAPAVDLFDEFPADAGPVSQLAEEFVIVNETEYAIPDYYLPDSPKFTAYSRRLVKTWGRLLLELHRMENHEADFALGFVFDETTEAMFEKGADGRVYYVNPAKLEYAGGRANRKVFKNRWATTGRNELLALAAHEFVHGLGYERHDELYAGKLTDLMGKVLNCRRRFDWCFKP